MIKPAAISCHSPKGRARTGTPTAGAAVAPVSLAAPDPVKPVPTLKSVYSRPAKPHATLSRHARITYISNSSTLSWLHSAAHIYRFPTWKSPIRDPPRSTHICPIALSGSYVWPSHHTVWPRAIAGASKPRITTLASDAHILLAQPTNDARTSMLAEPTLALHWSTHRDRWPDQRLTPMYCWLSQHLILVHPCWPSQQPPSVGLQTGALAQPTPDRGTFMLAKPTLTTRRLVVYGCTIPTERPSESH